MSALDQSQRIARIIGEYDSQGWHRTGSVVDHESARWLADLVSETGVDVSLEPFELSRIDPGECYLEVGGKRIPGLPMFDGAFTSAEGIRGRLGPVGSPAEIGVGGVSLAGGEDEALTVSRRSGDHRALVAVTVGGRPGLMPSNAPQFLSPFGCPVLQVGSEAQALLNEYIERGPEARLVAAVTRAPADSFNVVGRIDGRDRSLPPLVVMTPRSGWWQCASERGGGLACWLEVMRAIHETSPQRDVIFVATSGHEVGLYGIHAFLEHREGMARNAFAWIHFGANIGAAEGPPGRFAATDQGLKEQVRTALDAAGMGHAGPGDRFPSESGVVVSQGGKVAALVAQGNAVFHLKSDRWPGTVDVNTVAGYANAFADLAVQLSAA
jgi:hypothetical protein